MRRSSNNDAAARGLLFQGVEHAAVDDGLARARRRALPRVRGPRRFQQPAAQPLPRAAHGARAQPDAAAAARAVAPPVAALRPVPVARRAAGRHPKTLRGRRGAPGGHRREARAAQGARPVGVGVAVAAARPLERHGPRQGGGPRALRYVASLGDGQVRLLEHDLDLPIFDAEAAQEGVPRARRLAVPRRLRVPRRPEDSKNGLPAAPRGLDVQGLRHGPRALPAGRAAPPARDADLRGALPRRDARGRAELRAESREAQHRRDLRLRGAPPPRRRRRVQAPLLPDRGPGHEGPAGPVRGGAEAARGVPRRKQPDFTSLELRRIAVVFADVWTIRLLSSTAEAFSLTLTLESG